MGKIIEKIIKKLFPNTINGMLSVYGCKEYSRGYSDGYDNGRMFGYNNGHEDGFKKGWVECYNCKVKPNYEKNN